MYSRIDTPIERGLDNYSNAAQYIIEQLGVHDYAGEGLHTVKSKLWVLDTAPCSSEQGVIETDINNPLDHLAELNRELEFLDKYVRTLEGALEENETSFEELREQGIDNLASWLENVNEETGELNQAQDLPYSDRPTRLTSDQFTDLYELFSEKRDAGEWTSVDSIVKDVTQINLMERIKQQENSIAAAIPPDEAMAEIIAAAAEMRDKEDDNYVTEMNRIREEIISIMQSLNSSNVPTPPTDEKGLPTETWSGQTTVFVNLPAKRPLVSLTPGDSSHQGNRNMDEGFLYKIWKVSDTETSFDIDLTSPQTIVSGTIQTGHENEFGEIAYGYSYSFEGDTYISVLSGLTMNDLPSGGDAIGDLTRERVNVLRQRWNALNTLREDEIAKMGTRSIIEAMVNAEIPDLLPDMEAHLKDLKQTRVGIIGQLKDNNPEFL